VVLVSSVNAQASSRRTRSHKLLGRPRQTPGRDRMVEDHERGRRDTSPDPVVYGMVASIMIAG
jgi:hypothetical protein